MNRIHTSSTAAIPERKHGFFFGSILLILFGAGLLARIFSSFGELWFDELWTLNNIFLLKSPLQIFTTMHHENNHYLLSLWIWLCGDGRDWWLYRLPSIIAGMGAMVAAVRVASRRSRATAVVAALVFSLSYLSIFYSSEARGYAISGCMAIVAYDAMELFLKHRRWRYCAVYGIAVSAGILGSLTFVTIAIALGAWSFAVLLWHDRDRTSLYQFACLHAVPVTSVTLLWLIDIRMLINGGGPQVAIWSILCETASYMFGLPGDFYLGEVLLAAVFLLTLWQSVRMFHERDLRWLFFVTSVFVAPAALLVATGRVHVYPRYFLPNTFCWYLLASLAIGELWDRLHTKGRYLLASLLATWVAGNVVLFGELVTTGRGHYREALQFIAANSPPTSRPHIGSTNDLRSMLLFGYYSRYLPEPQRPVLVIAEELSTKKPEWVLATLSPYESVAARRELPVDGGAGYLLVKTFPSVKLSGFEANVYRISSPH